MVTAVCGVLSLIFIAPTLGPDEVACSQSCPRCHCPGCHVRSCQLPSQLRHFQLSGSSCLPGLCPGSQALLPWLCFTSPVSDPLWAELADCNQATPNPTLTWCGVSPPGFSHPFIRAWWEDLSSWWWFLGEESATSLGGGRNELRGFPQGQESQGTEEAVLGASVWASSTETGRGATGTSREGLGGQDPDSQHCQMG